ncbi:type II secretion system protein [Vibrio sp. B1Z05]|uniref:type II secretion system protein n=1 Tax=Vibrio sp. B1Z05 TaxID=2654980 RepID=UPI00128C6B5E|nr:type II secretion system protein [Vibrio sp. B1Z05]MPW36924.1 prepilin-type N-terminal cleavage/methylation domain-containing protein [Vibrio sp. B1Z05]
MKKQGGFTLIELVVVIVILGILAVTAAPRFLNLQSDARESSLQGLKGAMAGAGSIVYGKAAIEGIETKASGAIDTGITVVYGYPDATSSGIVSAVQGLDDDWTYEVSNNQLFATFAGTASSAIQSSNCFVTYTDAASSVATPSIVVTNSGC